MREENSKIRVQQPKKLVHQKNSSSVRYYHARKWLVSYFLTNCVITKINIVTLLLSPAFGLALPEYRQWQLDTTRWFIDKTLGRWSYDCGFDSVQRPWTCYLRTSVSATKQYKLMDRRKLGSKRLVLRCTGPVSWTLGLANWWIKGLWGGNDLLSKVTLWERLNDGKTI